MSLTPEKRKLIIRRTLFAVMLVLCAVLQNTPGLLPEPFGARQLGTVIIIVCISMFERETCGMFFGLFAGVMLDVTGGTQGINAILLTIFGYFCGLLVNNLIRNNVFTALLFSSAALLIYIGVYWLVTVVFSGAGDAGAVLLKFYLPSFVYTIVFLPFWFWIVRMIYRRFPSTVNR